MPPDSSRYPADASPILDSVGPSPFFAWIAVITLALVFGSFLNVCISRLPEHRSIVRPRSHCPRCQAPVRTRDNIPVASWLLLRGRCRDCGQSISVRYPLVELGFSALVAASMLRLGFTPEGAAASVFCFFALGLLVMDLETMLLPDAFTLPGLALGLLWATAMGAMQHDLPVLGSALSALASATLAAATWALVLLAIRWCYYAVRCRHGLGLGDVKLVAMLAAWLGNYSMALCFLLAVISATVAGLTAISGKALLFRKAGKAPSNIAQAGWGAMRLPLGVFLCAGGICSLFFGRQILRWYLSLFE